MRLKFLISFSVFAIAAVLFFNTNSINSSKLNFDLASLIVVNTANAECDGVYNNGDNDSWFGDGWDFIEVSGEKIGCVGGNGSCCERLCENGASLF
ncbi:MAG: hypothetical protein ACK5H1_00870 [Tenacibaculum sp.]